MTERQQEISNLIRVNRGKFEYYNQSRLKKLYDSITDEKTIELFEAIPFLLVSNHRDLPGYVDYPEMLTGLQGYRPSSKAMSFIRSRFPSVPLSLPQNGREPFIEMFALMGSGGTIAFNSESDFDFWVCAHVDRHDANSVAMFKRKCHAVETWIAERYGTEVHFFLNDIGKVKRNIFDDDSEETLAGSSLGELLKEEFFRSSIVVSGKIPFWWVVPPDADDRIYEDWLQAAAEGGIAGEFVDIGNLYTVVREDFLGAALFQILKSLGNPFKSIMKLGLLERYLHSTSGNPFISNIIKRSVHEGILDTENIDSYIIMFNQVFDYYHFIMNDEIATDLLKTCFYLKVNPQVSSYLKKSVTALPERVRRMMEYARQWQWHEAEVRKIDQFENWDIDSVNRLWNNTKKYILKGYKNILTSIQDRKNSHHITEEELRSISRKIYSHFSISDNKIDNSLTFKTYPPEKLLTAEFVRDREGNEFWVLSKRVIVEGYPAQIIIHKERNLLNLLVWVGLNKLYQKDFTRMDISKGLYTVDPNFLRELIVELSVYFSFKRVELHNSYFLRDPFPALSLVIINPFSKYAKKIEDMYFLYHNSWGETKYERFAGEGDVPKILVEILNGALRTKADFKSSVRFVSSQPFKSSREFDRIVEFVGDAYAFFTEKKTAARMRYVTMVGNIYHVFTLKRSGHDEVVTSAAYDSEVKLLYSLSYNTGVENAIRIDPAVVELNVLRTIIGRGRGDAVQIYYQIEHRYAYFYVSDERGALIFYRKTREMLYDYLARLYEYIQSFLNIVRSGNPESPLAKSARPILMFRLEKDTQFNCSLTEMNPELDSLLQAALKKIVPFTLSISFLDNGETGYRFTLPDGAYSETCSSHDLMSVARELKVLMQSVPGYLVYPSGVNLNSVSFKLYRDYTSFALSEKNRFELIVEKGLG